MLIVFVILEIFGPYCDSFCYIQLIFHLLVCVVFLWDIPNCIIFNNCKTWIQPCCVLSCSGRVWFFATLWTLAHQAPLSMGFSRQEYWIRLPFPSSGDLLGPGIEYRTPALQANSLPLAPPGKPCMTVNQNNSTYFLKIMYFFKLNLVAKNKVLQKFFPLYFTRYYQDEGYLHSYSLYVYSVMLLHSLPN